MYNSLTAKYLGLYFRMEKLSVLWKVQAVPPARKVARHCRY